MMNTVKTIKNFFEKSKHLGIKSGLSIGIIALSSTILVVTLIAIALSGFGVRKILLIMVVLVTLFKGVDLFYSTLNLKFIQNIITKEKLNTWISLHGGISVVCFTAYTFLSYGMMHLIPNGGDVQNRAIFSKRLAGMLGLQSFEIVEFLNRHSALSQKEILILTYSTPIIIITGTTLSLIILLSRHRLKLDYQTPKKLYYFGVAFAIICSLGLPILVLDFWHPFAWGRMIVASINPYYVEKPIEYVNDLPIAYTNNIRMMYGPLWAVINGAVMWIAGNRIIQAFLIFKIILATAWIGSLRLIWALLHKQSPWRQSLGILVFGWLPISVLQSVAEGHNDIIMVFFVLLWLYGLQRKWGLNTSLPLAASVVVKYVSAPLFLLDFLHARYSLKISVSKYLPRLAAAGVLIAAFLALFYRSPEFFAYLPETSRWHFFTLREMIITLQVVNNFWIDNLAGSSRLLFIFIAGYFIFRYVRNPNLEPFWIAVLAVMCAVLFSISSHIWPWYMLWVLGLAALVPRAVLSRWVIGLALAMPFSLLVLLVFPNIDTFYQWDVPTLLIYTFAILFVIFLPPRWFSHSSTTEIELEKMNPVSSKKSKIDFSSY